MIPTVSSPFCRSVKLKFVCLSRDRSCLKTISPFSFFKESLLKHYLKENYLLLT